MLALHLLAALLLAGSPASAQQGFQAEPPGAPAAKGGYGYVWAGCPGCSQPESAYYDPESKLLFLSNIAGNPTEKDGKGWISKLRPDGRLLKERWVDGLDAPKGLRSRGGRLYVTDIDRLVEIDIAKGSVERRIAVPGAKFLNDVALDPEGNVYLSDTPGSRIYLVKPGGEVSTFAEGDPLESPNGLYVHGGRLYVAAWGLAAPDWSTKAPGRLYSLDLKTKEQKFLTAPLGNLDGLERTPAGNWLVSDWAAGKVFSVSPDGRSWLLFVGFKGAADIGYVPERNLLVVPRMQEDGLSAYDLGKHPAPYLHDAPPMRAKPMEKLPDGPKRRK